MIKLFFAALLLGGTWGNAMGQIPGQHSVSAASHYFISAPLLNETATVSPATGVVIIDTDDLGFCVTPNPAQNYIILHASCSLPDFNFEIYNAPGNIVMLGTITDASIDVSKLDDGLYYIRVSKDDLSEIEVAPFLISR